MFVADEPQPRNWPQHLLDRGVLRVASTSEVYGAERTVDADRQRATFAEVLAEALAEGYTGIRVAADNTSLTVGPERLEAWARWEAVADQFLAENPVTGLCAFDRSRLDDELLGELMAHHEVGFHT